MFVHENWTYKLGKCGCWQVLIVEDAMYYWDCVEDEILADEISTIFAGIEGVDNETMIS